MMIAPMSGTKVISDRSGRPLQVFHHSTMKM